MGQGLGGPTDGGLQEGGGRWGWEGVSEHLVGVVRDMAMTNKNHGGYFFYTSTTPTIPPPNSKPKS